MYFKQFCFIFVEISSTNFNRIVFMQKLHINKELIRYLKGNLPNTELNEIFLLTKKYLLFQNSCYFIQN
jgi:hypothetical protein